METEAPMRRKGHGAKCPLCGSRDVTGRSYIVDGHIIEQSVCGHWFTSTRPSEEELRQMYASPEYFRGGSKHGYSQGYEAQASTLRMGFRRLLNQMIRHGITGESLLEVGCGYGFFLAEARKVFGKVVGMEMSHEAARRAVVESGAPVAIGGIEDAPRGPFDVVAAWEVLEHVTNPIGFLVEAKRRLVPGGWAIVSVPNAGSLARKVMGSAWPSWKPAEHVSHFTEESLRMAFGRAGFVQIKRIPFLHAYPLGFTLGKIFESPMPRWLDRIPVFLPTLLVMAGRKQPSLGG